MGGIEEKISMITATGKLYENDEVSPSLDVIFIFGCDRSVMSVVNFSLLAARQKLLR
jgi:hypothetical protein